MTIFEPPKSHPKQMIFDEKWILWRMEISGPFFDHAKKRSGRNNCWYLRYSAPRTNPDGSFVRKAGGKIVLQRHRPYYESRKLAEADKPRIQEQFTKTGPVSFFLTVPLPRTTKPR